MGRIANLLSFVRASANGAKVSDVKADPGGGAIVTAQHFSSPGDDSHPLPGDYAAIIGAAGTGRESAVGYVDPKADQKAQAGDKRIYARDSGTGAAVAEVWLKNNSVIYIANANGAVELTADGEIEGANANGFFRLTAGGDFEVNGVVIKSNGDVTVPSSLTLAGKELADHDHNILSGSSAPGPTGPNN